MTRKEIEHRLELMGIDLERISAELDPTRRSDGEVVTRLQAARHNLAVARNTLPHVARKIHQDFKREFGKVS